MSSRTCPDWPLLMERAPELQFKHYTLREAQLPAEVLGVDVGQINVKAKTAERLGALGRGELSLHGHQRGG